MMSEYMIGFVIFGAFMLAAPAVLADYQLFKEWREERGTVYPEGSEVVTLFTIGKDGELGATDGSIWWDNYGNEAWTVESNFQDYANRFLINFDGDLAEYYDIGVVLTGSRGPMIPINPNGLARDMHFFLNGHWGQLTILTSSLYGTGIEWHSYLDGTKTNSSNVNVTNDAMQTFLWHSDPVGLLGIGPGGSGFGIRLDDALRNGSSFSIIAVKRPTEVPEPATLALVGAGLAGLGLARRRRKK